MDLSTAIFNLYENMSTKGHTCEDLTTILLRSYTFSDSRCFDLQISPLPCRRTTSVVSEFIPLTPFRSRSARHPSASPSLMMNRHNNVSVARLYDWSEQDKEEVLSVSKLYREIAGGAGASVPRCLSEKVRPRVAPNNTAGGGGGGGSWGGTGSPRLNPGRMFLRDKGMLTKGEREIIQGIYKNRGDLRRTPNKSDFFVRSHHDAWLVGKPGVPANKPSTEIPRESPRGALMEVTVPASQCSEASLPPVSDGSVSREERHSPTRTTCIVCLREQQLLQQLQQQQQQQQQQQHQKTQNRSKHRNSQPSTLPQNCVLRPVNVNDTFKPRGDESPLLAPPASPNSSAVFRESGSKPVPLGQAPSHVVTSTSSSSKYPSRSQECQSADLGVVDYTGETNSDSEGSQDSENGRRKLHVKVYLPKVVSEAVDEDFRTCVLEGRPALARERPLSNSDLKQGRSKLEDIGGRRGEVESSAAEEKRGGQDKQNGEREELRSPQRPGRGDVRRKDDHAELLDQESDSENSKNSSRRVPLHTPPITLLNAESEGHSSEQEE